MTPQERGTEEEVDQGKSSDRPAASAESRQGRIGVAVLGLDAWAVALFVPLILASADAGSFAVSAVALIPLGLGLAAYPRWGPEVFLGVFPCALIVCLAICESRLASQLHDALSLSLGAAALALHILGVTLLIRVAPTREVGVRPLSDALHIQVDHATRRARLRGLIVTVATLGAFAILILSPRIGGVLKFDRAETTRTFVASVSVVVATVVLIGFVAPATRIARSLPKTRRTGRVVLLLSAAIMGAGVYWLLQGR